MIQAFIYTDGSCGPGMPGVLGAGYHGYYIDTKLPFKKTTDLPTDGYPSIYGYIGPDNEADYMSNKKEDIIVNPLCYVDGMWSDATHTLGYSNEAEVIAIAMGLKNSVTVKDLEIDKVTILSDSQVALLVFQNATRLLNQHKITFGDVETYKIKIEEVYPKATDNIKNYLVFAIDAILTVKEKYPKLEIEYLKVKGHNGNIGNEKADRLAVTARKNCLILKMVDEVVFTYAPTRYWKANVDRHPFLRYKELFFLHNDISNLPYVTVMNYTSAIPVGQRSAEPIYGLIRLDKEPILDMIKEINQVYEKMYRSRPILLYAMDLNEIFHPEHIIDVNNFGKYVFTRNANEQLSLLDKYLTMFPIKPSGLAKQVYDKTMNMSTIVEQCLADTLDGKLTNEKEKLIYQDITDLIFKKEVVKNKEKMTCILPNGNKEIPVKVKLNNQDVSFKLYHNVDIIDRNYLRALEKHLDTKVWLVLKQESDTVYTYFTVVNIPSLNTYGIWHNMFSSRLFLEKEK